MTLRVAISGTGDIAERHLGALAALGSETVQVVGVAGRSRERAAGLAARAAPGAAPFTDAAEMLDATAPDALFVCHIPSEHGAAERAAIARRVPFLVEKPLALDWPTAAAIASEVEQAGLVTAVGYQWRYHRSVERARELLAGRRVALAQGTWLTRTPAPAWWSRRATSGGQMLEQTTHLFDLARLFLGEPIRVHAATAHVARASHPDSDIEEVSLATVTFDSGAIAGFASTCILASSHRVGLQLYAEGMALEIGAATLAVDTGEERRELRLDGDATVAQDRAFLDAVRSGDASLVRSTYADALGTHRLTTGAVESARTGRALTLAVA